MEQGKSETVAADDAGAVASAAFDEPAVFINFFNVMAFADETVRVSLGEYVTEDEVAIRGAFRITLQKATEFAEALKQLVAAGTAQRVFEAATGGTLN